jgi:hypothetical protein
MAWLVCGCSSTPEGGTATGTVLLDGRPLDGAVVQLWPRDDLKLGVYGGKTDADGKIVFHLAEGQRIKPGRYVLLIAKRAPRPTARASSPREEEQVNILSGPEGFRNLLPAIYSDKARSPFTVEIRPGPNELPPMELKSRPGP